MATQVTLADHLEDLRRLINESVDIVQEDLASNNDPPLDIAACKRNPLRDRYDFKVSRALKCIASTGTMLRVLCEPEAYIHDILLNFHDLTALFVACQADVANVLHERHCSSGEIAKITGIEADKISRFLRALCNIHVFREVSPDVFGNNELSLLLQSQSRRAHVGFCAEESRLSSCKAWDALTEPGFKDSDAVNKSAFNIAYKTDLDIFSYWKQVKPDLAQRAGWAFTDKGINSEQRLALYPWAEEQSGTLVVDVGGGVGGVTLPILRKCPNLTLQVQDLPANEENFHDFLKRNYPDILQTGRASFLGQDFFQEQATKHADIYFICHVLLDWPDNEALSLLRNLTAVMLPRSKLLICEPLAVPICRSGTTPDDLADDPCVAPEPLLPNWGASFATRMDLQVLACVNGRERTEAGISSLAVAAGLAVRKVWRSLDGVIIECVPGR